MKTPIVKSLELSSLFEKLLLFDAPQVLSIPEGSLVRDFSTISRRIASEGESFLTKTLPSFGKAIDKSLDGDTPLFTSAFKKCGRTRLPAFLQAVTQGVFNPRTGMLRPVICIESLRILRQICFWVYKLEGACRDEQVLAAIDKFVDCDKSLPEPDYDFRLNCRVLSVARAVVTSLFEDFVTDTVLPKQGPGAVSAGEKGVQKYIFKRHFRQLEVCFPYFLYFSAYRDYLAGSSVYDKIECDYSLSRLETVPKDSRGPRIIAMEPKEYMWLQQGIKDMLYKYIESHPMTKGRVNFTDQSVNQRLAQDYAHYVTLDMKEASDRVSLALVRQLFAGVPGLLAWLECTRTPGVVLPSNHHLLYKKFAPMGSALCFPIEAICFYALAVAAVHVEQGVALQLCLRHTYVYGDDIIVPHGWEKPIFKCFPDFALMLNQDKCCTRGYFRESCGMDAYAGLPVQPVRLKKRIIAKDALPSLVAHRNNLYERGYRHAASELRHQLNIKLPTVPDALTAGFLAWQGDKAHFSQSYRLRWNAELQVIEAYLLVVRPDLQIMSGVEHDWWLYQASLGSGIPESRLDETGNVVRCFANHKRKRLVRRWVNISPYVCVLESNTDGSILPRENCQVRGKGSLARRSSRSKAHKALLAQVVEMPGVPVL